MKHFFLLLITIVLCSCNNNNVNTSYEPQKIDSIKSKNTKIVTKKTIVENGEVVERYENGAVKMRGMMKNGQRDGLWTSWYEDGLPWSETNFEQGKKTGKTTAWFPKNKIRYEGYFDQDKECGKWTFWDESGKQIQTKDYGTKK